MSTKMALNQNHDYNIDSPKQVLCLENSVKLREQLNHKHKLLSNVYEPPLKKKKVVIVEKVISNINNNNSQNFKNACGVTGYSTSNTPTIAKDKNVEATKSTDKGMSSVACQSESFQLLSAWNLCNNPKAMKYYAGLKNYDKFMSVFDTLGPDKYDLKYYDSNNPVNLSHLDQFLIVLILLKQHKSHYEISIMFNVTLKDIKNLFITWIRFMRIEWNHIKLEGRKMHEKIEILNNNKKNVLQPINQDSMEVIDLENEKPDSNDCLKKTYKILLNGPANYIESHLAKDIYFVCQRLYYFATSSNETLLKLPTKKISLL